MSRGRRHRAYPNSHRSAAHGTLLITCPRLNGRAKSTRQCCRHTECSTAERTTASGKAGRTRNAAPSVAPSRSIARNCSSTQIAIDVGTQQERLGHDMTYRRLEVGEQQARQLQPRLIDHQIVSVADQKLPEWCFWPLCQRKVRRGDAAPRTSVSTVYHGLTTSAAVPEHRN